MFINVTDPAGTFHNGTANSSYFDANYDVYVGTGTSGGGFILFLLISFLIYFTYPKWSCCKRRPWRDLKKKELEEWERQREISKSEKDKEKAVDGESDDFLRDEDQCNGMTCMIDGKRISWIDLSYMERKHHRDEIEWRGGPGVAIRKKSTDRRHSTPIRADINRNQEGPLKALKQKRPSRTSLTDQNYLDIKPVWRKKTSIPGSAVILDVSTNSLDDFSSCYDSMSRCGSVRSGNIWSMLNGDPPSGCTSYASFESLDVFEDAMDYSSDYDTYSVNSTPVTSV